MGRHKVVMFKCCSSNQEGWASSTTPVTVQHRGSPTKILWLGHVFFMVYHFKINIMKWDFWHMRNKDDRRRRKTSFFSARDIRLDKQESSKLRIISRQLYQSISIDRRHVTRSWFVRQGQVGLHHLYKQTNKQTTDEGWRFVW